MAGSNRLSKSLWIHSPSPIPNGSSSMVRFENSCDEDYDGCFLRPGKKRRLSGDQVQFLEKSFEAENKLEPDRKVQLAKELGLEPRQVAIWFQNRRARSKTKQLEIDYESLRSSFVKLESDYDDLMKQTQKLKEEVLFLKDKLVVAETKVVSGNGSDSEVAPSSAKSDVVDSDSPRGDSSNVFGSEEDDDDNNNDFGRSFSPAPEFLSYLPEVGDGHFENPHLVEDQLFCFWS